jgi:hypothetical protein
METHLYQRLVQLHHGDMPTQAHEPSTTENDVHSLSVLHASLGVRLNPSIRAEEMRVGTKDTCVAAERIIADSHFRAFRVVDAFESVAAQRRGLGLQPEEGRVHSQAFPEASCEVGQFLRLCVRCNRVAEAAVVGRSVDFRTQLGVGHGSACEQEQGRAQYCRYRVCAGYDLQIRFDLAAQLRQAFADEVSQHVLLHFRVWSESFSNGLAREPKHRAHAFFVGRFRGSQPLHERGLEDHAEGAVVHHPFENHHRLCGDLVVVPQVFVGGHEAEWTAESDGAQDVEREEAGDDGHVDDGVAVLCADQIDHVDDSRVDVGLEGVDVAAIVLGVVSGWSQYWLVCYNEYIPRRFPLP